MTELRKIDLTKTVDVKLSYGRKFHNKRDLRRWTQMYVHTTNGELNSQIAPAYESENNYEPDYDLDHDDDQTSPEEFTTNHEEPVEQQLPSEQQWHHIHVKTAGRQKTELAQ